MNVLRRALDGVRLQNDITADRLAHIRSLLENQCCEENGGNVRLGKPKYFEVEAPTFSGEAFPTSQHAIKHQHQWKMTDVG